MVSTYFARLASSCSRVNVAGPTTLAALLNSLQLGFRSLAIQERSSEVWALLGAVKDEFKRVIRPERLPSPIN